MKARSAWPEAVCCMALLACGKVRDHAAPAGSVFVADGAASASDAGAPRDGAAARDAAAYHDASAAPNAGDGGCETWVVPLEKSNEDGGVCGWAVPDVSKLGVFAYDPYRVTVTYEDTSAGPRYLVDLGFVPDASHCDASPASVYYDPPSQPARILGCPSVCALHFADDAGTPGGTMRAKLGCVLRYPVP